MVWLVAAVENWVCHILTVDIHSHRKRMVLNIGQVVRSEEDRCNEYLYPCLRSYSRSSFATRVVWQKDDPEYAKDFRFLSLTSAMCRAELPRIDDPGLLHNATSFMFSVSDCHMLHTSSSTYR